MTWTNAFDTGNCTVALYNYLSGTLYWSGILRKGHMSPQFNDNNGNGPYQIAVDQHGVVTLTNAGTFTFNGGIELRVQPAFAISNVACRMRAFNLDPGAVADGSGSHSSAFVSNGNAGPSTDVPLTRVGTSTAMMPDPAAPSATAGVISMSVVADYPSATNPNVGTVISAIYEITTANPPPVAPDLPLAAPYNSGGSPAPTNLTPTITENSAVVTPDALVIATTAEHGSVGVSGSSLQYLPDVGFTGSDSFSYYATYGGLNSNIATISVTVSPAPSGAFWTDFIWCEEN